MPRLTLQHPIRTLENQLLFPPGSFLTEETLETVIYSDKNHPYEMVPLLSYGSVKEDCLHFFSTPPYEAIFSDKKQLLGRQPWNITKGEIAQDIPEACSFRTPSSKSSL